jgi:hypothetical protein
VIYVWKIQGFVTKKLAACIYAALHFPESNPAVVAVWGENQLIITTPQSNAPH